MMSSRYSKIAALLLVLSMLAIPNLFSQIEYKSLLTGRNEVMPVLTPATGSILATLTGNELVITGEFQQLSGTVLENGANIHLGMAGQEGAVILGLIPSLNEAQTGGTFNAGLNTFSLGQEQIDLLAARELYINITTTAFESGEIRGQLLPDALTYFDANLLGSNEVPAVNSFGSGHVTIELVSATQIAVSGSFNNLGSDFDASIGAHLHIGSVGENGDVLFPLTPQVTADNRSGVFNAADNTFDIDFNQLLAIGERKIYANVHSLNHPGGELRGQFVPAEASAVFRAKLSGSQAVPVQTSLAEGVAMAEIYGDTLMIVSGSFKDLDSPIVTTNTSNRPGLYAGFAGEDGGFLFPLNLSSAVSGLNGEIEASNNVFLLDNTQASRLYERGIYVNLASETQSNGALRGQFVPESQIVLHGFMSGTLAVPPSNSVGHGNLVAELNENNLTFSGSFQELDGLPGRPSLNIGYAGSTGEQIFSFTADENNIRATDNSFDLSDEQMEALMARQFYVNLPSSAQSSGELRAQILPEATTYFVGTLSGASQTEAVNTAAYGQVILEYTNGVASLTGSFDGLESDFNINAAGGVHIYNGFAGSNGEIVQRLNVSLNDENRGGVFEATANTFNLEAAATNDLIERGEYVSIVTNDQVNGAIRGQLLPFANAYFTTTLSAFNTLPLPVNSTAVGALKAELRGNELTVTGSANDLSANLETSSTQFYLGRAGMSGEAQFELSQTLSDDSRSVTYLAANNTYRLDDVQIRNLKRDRQHVTITNTTYPEGELRGQMLAEPNYAPNGATTIIEPANGESLIIEGDPTGMFRLSWESATDESDLYYVIQSSEFEDFRTFENKGVLAGFDNTLLYSVEIMDSILMAEGLEVGESIQQHYRFVACDGALNTPGAASLLTYTRGEVETVSGADLELFITGPTGAYEQFSEIPYQISVINRGGQNARNIFVSAPLPAGMVFTSAEPSVGDYNLFFGWWNIDVLNAGDTAVLDLTLFTLEEEEAITNYVQIIGAQPADPDSRPNNGVAPEPREDDEAAFTIFSEPTVRGGTTADLSLTLETVEDEFTVFSNTTYVLTLMNEGPDSAANIRVSALIPQGMVFTSAETDAEGGSYRVVTQDWEVPFLASGASVTLELTLFSLVEGRALTLFAQVIASDQEDPDSTPANDLDGVPDEDDEASVTITPAGGLDGGEEADLSINLSIDREEYEVFTDYVYTFTLVNSGPDDAVNIFIDAQLPDSLSFTSKAASVGDWNNFFQYWYVPFIASGETATLQLTLFTLSRETPITFFAQIIDVEQDDPDSTPNNNTTGVPVEDDEASITITPMGSNANALEDRGKVFGSIYPVPTTDILNVNVNSTKERPAVLSIIDLNGTLLRQLPVDLLLGDNNFQFEVADLSAGMYYLYLTDQQNQLLSWQFVKVE